MLKKITCLYLKTKSWKKNGSESIQFINPFALFRFSAVKSLKEKGLTFIFMLIHEFLHKLLLNIKIRFAKFEKYWPGQFHVPVFVLGPGVYAHVLGSLSIQL